MFDEKTHPLVVIPWLENGQGGHELTFEFSTYSYKPQIVEDMRSLHFVKGRDVSSWFVEAVKNLRTDEDYAFHSRVHINGSMPAHLPMIDFMELPTRQEMAHIRAVLSVFGVKDLMLFHSGRSLHLYGRSFLPYEKWIQLLGRLLLLNIPGKRNIIDSRWVGHRLMAGYGTLRWTKNNPHYRGMPRKIDENDLSE